MISIQNMRNDHNLEMNQPNFRPLKPRMMGLDIIRIKLKEEGIQELEHYLKLKDRIQCTYENALKEHQKMVIPRLDQLKQKYWPVCCRKDSWHVDPFNYTHPHFEYRILELLETLRVYLNSIIKTPKRILEIKLAD